MKIAIYYDTLISPGGAERVVLRLAEKLNADVFTSGYDKKLQEILPHSCRVQNIGNFFIKYVPPIGILFEAPLRFFLFKQMQSYDVHIYFGFTSIFAAKEADKNVWFCFTPNRMLYDLRDIKLKSPNLLVRVLFTLYNFLFLKLDQQTIKTKFQTIIAQTNVVKARISKYYGLDSQVIYSPVDTKNLSFKSFGDYYLTVGRLFPEKRVDLIIKAFTKMPQAKLVVVGDGPEKQKLLNLSKGAANIQILSNVRDKEIANLYANCKATIFMPINEDYGLIPLEGNAAGKICIAANEGGCLETVINGQTGFLIEPSYDALSLTLKKVESLDLNSMVIDCQKHSLLFSLNKIADQWQVLLQKIHATI